jgi:hypothetical protein
VRQAEHGAVVAATTRSDAGSDRTAVVLADRSLVIRKQVEQAYPITRKARVTYSGSGYRDGYERGQRADIGASRLTPTRGRALTTHSQ